MESANTTATGALQLFAGNCHSDAYALLRMIYEVAALMHYGNGSPECSAEVLRTMFKSGLDDAAHAKGEWALIRKAQSNLEEANSGLVAVRQRINNFGAHVSRAKVVLGHIDAASGKTVSMVFQSNHHKSEFLMGLDLLHGVFAMALEQYDCQASLYPGAEPSVSADITAHNSQFLSTIRPRLQSVEQPPHN